MKDADASKLNTRRFPSIMWRTAAVLLLAYPAMANGGAATNLACNPGFEEEPAVGEVVARWNAFTTLTNRIALVSEHARSGVRAVRITAQGKRNQLQGLFQALPVIEGATYTFSVFARKDKDDPLRGSPYVTLLIEWKDATGQLLGKVTGAGLYAGLSQLRWEVASVGAATAPAGATEANFCIHFGDGDRGGRGSVLLDDAYVLCVTPFQDDSKPRNKTHAGTLAQR